MTYIKPAFTIIRSRNNLNVAETIHGTRVFRTEKIFFPEIHRSVACAPYMEHFIFNDTSNTGWTLFCTCGSPAVIVGYQAYKRDSSPTSKQEDTLAGELLVCYHHASYGKHLDGVG